jgi:integrase
MAEDAIGDDAATHNAFAGIRVRGADPRVRKPPREIRIWTFQQMLAFAQGGRADVRAVIRRPQDPRGKTRHGGRLRFYPARDYEALLLTPGFTGLRLGELLALKEAEFDGKTFHLHGTAHEGELFPSGEQKNHERAVPVPPTLAKLISRSPRLVESEFLFPTPTGKLWREPNFYRDVWVPAELATGLDPTPHELRHSYISNLRAVGIDDADLARVAGHAVETMVSVYTHALERSHRRSAQPSAEGISAQGARRLCAGPSPPCFLSRSNSMRAMENPSGTGSGIYVGQSVPVASRVSFRPRCYGEFGKQ